MNEALAVIIGYLLGTFPTAYLVSRHYLGKDIRKMGGGNVGGLNTFREVGAWQGVLVGVVDLLKGVFAVLIARYLLEMEPAFVILTGLAAVVGHNWMIWLKFTGGKGMATAIGALIIILFNYGYGTLFFIFLAVIAVPLFSTNNVALGMGVGLFVLPIIVWFGTKSIFATLMAVTLLLLIGLKFLPTALAALKNRGAGALGKDEWQREKN